MAEKLDPSQYANQQGLSPVPKAGGGGLHEVWGKALPYPYADQLPAGQNYAGKVAWGKIKCKKT